MSSRHSTRQPGKLTERQSARRRQSPASLADRQWSIVVKGTTMGWINTFRAWGEAERPDPADETVINGAPYDANKRIRGPIAAGRPAYREEYMRDHGPDLDEWLDGTESG